jgi:hypothetical protein
MTIGHMAERILRETKRPMHVREIYAVMQRDRLYEFKAKDPVSVVAKALRTGKQFEKTAPGTYKLRV